MLEDQLQKIAPQELGISGDLYGLQFGSHLQDQSLHKIFLSLDPSIQVIKEVIKQKGHILITHHGFTHSSKLYINDEILEQVQLLSGYGIRLFVVHSAWDAAQGGVSESFAKAIGLDLIDNFNFQDGGGLKPIGRIGVPIQENCDLNHLIQTIKRNLHLPMLQVHGELNTPVKRVVVIGGRGIHESELIKVREAECDTLVTGELTYPEFLMARKLGINLITTSHYESEKLGMMSLQRILALIFPRDEFYYIESGNPISYI
ncbi:MAG: Nif3-like dinuclear metal center hexameric protein [Promethearchaeota archaeon]